MSRLGRTGSTDGFTLVELLVAITILVVITGPLASAVVMALRTTGDATDRLARSHDIQTTETTFASDVQSSRALEVLTGAASGCGHPTAFLLRLSWTDTQPRIVTYTVETDAGSGETQMVRWTCTAGTSSNRRVLAHVLSPTVAPDLQCQPVACDVATPQRPQDVRLELTDAAGERFVLRGTRRVAL